jgi:hypothetical protein
MRARQVSRLATQRPGDHCLKERRQGRLRIALPWLDCAPDADLLEAAERPRSSAGEWLVARRESSVVEVRAWREWLLGGLDAGAEMLRACPAGPCSRSLYSAVPPEGTWGCARPVHLLTAIDHLQLAPGRLALDEDESARLVGDINRHLEGGGFRLHLSGATDGWHLECAQPLECTGVEPDDASGRNLRDLMPGGPDGARVRSLMNEIQMLLHDHPVNVARAQRRLPAVNSVWLWGIGSLGKVSPAGLPPLYTDDAWLTGLWRLHGASPGSPGEFAASGASDTDTLVAPAGAPDGDSATALAFAEATCFAPAKARLVQGATAMISMLLGERSVEVSSRARYRFWRRQRPLSEALA